MKRIFVVTERELDIAQKLQDKLLSTTGDSGILFVAVTIQPACDLQPLAVYKIVIGCENYPQAVTSYARYLLKEDVEKESQLQIESYKGLIRKNV